MGDEVLISPQGVHLFLNKYQDTIKIQTKAILDESWKAYEDHRQIIEARIIQEDTMSFLGLSDSAKTIGFQVFSKSMEPLPQALNGYTMIFTKNHGVIKTLNFYQFPDYEQLNYGWVNDGLREHNLVGRTNPRAGIQNLTWFDVFDYQPGDEIHLLDDSFYYLTEDLLHSRTCKTMMLFLERENFADSIIYRYVRKQTTRIVDGQADSASFIHDTSNLVIRRNHEFDKLPGEPVISENQAYSNFMATGSVLSKTISPTGVVFRNGNDSCWTVPIFDGCFMDEQYLAGLGGPYGSCTEAFMYGASEKKLVYYKKGEDSWGTPYDLTSIKRFQEPENYFIYPNPAIDQIKIESSRGEIECIRLFDLSGLLITEKTIRAPQYQLDLGLFEPGIYILYLCGSQGRSAHKIVVTK